MGPNYILARNSAKESQNPIHTDAYAQSIGLRGGLVGGTTLLGYLAQPACAEWGEAWCGGGAITAEFRAPVYDGDLLQIVVTHVEDRLEIHLENESGVLCARATATTRESADEQYPQSGPATSESAVAELPLISYATLTGAPRLRSLSFVVDPSGLLHGPLMLTAVVPPEDRISAPIEHLSNASISIMYENFRAVGPRILTGLEIRYYRPVMCGQVLTASGTIVAAWRRKDRTYAQNEITISDDSGRGVAVIKNTTIWEIT